MSGGFTVVHVPDDDAAVLNVAAANAPDGGRLAIRIRPGTRRFGWVTRDLLAALGVDFTLSGAGRNEYETLHVLQVRLVTQQVTDLLVVGAEQLTADLLTDLILLAAAANTRLWLLTRPPVADKVMTVLGDWCAAGVPLPDAARCWPGLLPRPGQPANPSTPTSPAAPSAAGGVEPRELPLVDATTLLAASRALLPAEQAAWVHRRLAAAVAATHPLLAGGDVEETVARWLRERYDQAGTLTQFVTDVRGLQIAGLWHGLLVAVDVPTLLGTAAASPSAAARTPEVWRRLRAYRAPVRAAACALAAAHLGAAAICAVRIADTAEDGTAVTVDGQVVPIEAAAAAYVATQRLARVAAGAGPDAPLLAGEQGQPHSDKSVARLLSEARAELGVAVTTRLVERVAPDTATTLRRWGVTVTRLGEPVPGTPATRTPDTAADAPAVTAAPASAALLDVGLLTRRRQEMGLSRQDVAKHLGVTTAVVKRLESGVNHGEQPLGLLLRLAELLALDLADLLPRQRPAGAPTPAVGDTATAAAAVEDARAVGAALHTLGVLVPVETLAQVLGWDAARLTAAVDALTVTAAAAGLRVHRLQNRVSLVRDVTALPAEDLERVLRYDAVRAGLNPTHGRLLLGALTRAIAPPTQRGGRHLLARSNAEKVAAASLVGAGILSTDDTGDLQLTADAAVSLLVPTARAAR